jgi:hypothetical protein
MRAKFLCQSASPENGINQMMLVHDEYKTAKSQPTIISINSPDVICREGDVCLVEITVISHGQNGREPKPK